VVHLPTFTHSRSSLRFCDLGFKFSISGTLPVHSCTCVQLGMWSPKVFLHLCLLSTRDWEGFFYVNIFTLRVSGLCRWYGTVHGYLFFKRDIFSCPVARQSKKGILHCVRLCQQVSFCFVPFPPLTNGSSFKALDLCTT
jgi:hypothetical protein